MMMTLAAIIHMAMVDWQMLQEFSSMVDLSYIENKKVKLSTLSYLLVKNTFYSSI